MSTQQQIEIVSEPKGSNFIKVKINGHEIRDVRSVSYSVNGETRTPTVKIELTALDVRIDSPCILKHKELGNIKAIEFENESGLRFDKLYLKQKGEE